VPQLAASVVKSEHVPAQLTVCAGQVHTLFSQTRLLPQISEHMPQLALFDVVSTHAFPHAVKPGAEHRTAHTPSSQMGAAPPQRFPHAPQFALLETRLTQLPAPPPGPAHWV
jgi:hypothetical protein